MNENEVTSLIARLEAAFEHDLGETTLSVYVDALHDLDYEPARMGVETIIRSGGRFFPRISEIRRMAMESSAAFPSFGEAWREMSSKASAGDGINPPGFSHPVIRELVRQIGWENFRLSEEGDTYFEHAASQRYEAICEREMRALLTGAPSLADRPRLELPGEDIRRLVEGIGDR